MLDVAEKEDTDLGSDSCSITRLGLLRRLSGQRIRLQCRKHRRHRFDPWVGKIPWRRAWLPTPVFLPGESH